MAALRFVIPCLVVSSLAGCHSPQPASVETGLTGAHLYPGLDRYHRPIDTTSDEAQQWFDQGMQLLYGFNHDEAIRSFREAAAQDPSSPMPWWGVAYAHGMNINDRFMTDERYRAASQATEKALLRLDDANPVEAALVRAVATRYSWPPPAEQNTLDVAYAEAMEEVYRRFPDDPDVACLYAEALMDLQPWDYWTIDREPKGRIEDVTVALEAVLERDPNHPGACHFYIHAMEVAHPERAEPYADRLLDRVPGAGHLVHMPSHIYVRVGRYADAANANTLAVAVDRAYLETAPEPAIYMIYYAHNLHFLAYSSMMEGNYESAIRAARALEAEMPEAQLREFAGLIEGIMPTTYHVMVRFGKWNEILEEPQRPPYRLVSRAVHHYARGVAFSALGRTEEARAEIELFEEAAAAVPEEWLIFNNRVDTVLPIGRAMLEGELAFREGRYEDAFAALRRGVALEDALIYDEPPGWMLPVRHSLGALLMAAGRPAEAEQVYREDLERNRNNGWGLLGLRQALAAQGDVAEIAAIDAKLAVAFRRSDVEATSSCFCAPGAPME
jgi:tetratricopeptide (TPR) repeat protein